MCESLLELCPIWFLPMGRVLLYRTHFIRTVRTHEINMYPRAYIINKQITEKIWQEEKRRWK